MFALPINKSIPCICVIAAYYSLIGVSWGFSGAYGGGRSLHRPGGRQETAQTIGDHLWRAIGQAQQRTHASSQNREREQVPGVPPYQGNTAFPRARFASFVFLSRSSPSSPYRVALSGSRVCIPSDTLLTLEKSLSRNSSRDPATSKQRRGKGKACEQVCSWRNK